ncbi:MAG: hypothetical protein JWO76_2755, partial [Nocardioides sp.]|nr:hypothetical protein [Nocardioides sp.]
MWSLVFHQAMRRRARTGAVILAILVASVSFALLTSAVATSRLAVEGTVDQNFRGAYDILVRPVGSANSIERSQNLVQQNYLANVYGGITTDQLRTIQKIQG